MYAVIFKAEIKELDAEYFETAKNMKYIAMKKYGCSNFISVTENNYEISISYWENQDQIKKWKEDKEHLESQQLGKDKWYKSYSVQIVEVLREYNHVI